MIEIERKFKLDKLPSSEILKNAKKINMEQSYISLSPEIRIRKHNDSFCLEFKDDGTLSRKNVKIEIDSTKYESLKSFVKTNTLTKTRYCINLNDDNIAEIDVYSGKYHGLMVVEVEFDSLEDANLFKPPSWFGKEITNDKNYKNKNIALFGLKYC